jgi:hypothetical protein
MARLGLGPLLLAGAAAFGYYKFSKMTAAEKEQLKQNGVKLYEDNVPQNIRDMIAGKQDGATQTAGGHNQFSGGGSPDGFSQM